MSTDTSILEHVAELRSGRLEYRVRGPSDGPAVVLVHGYLVDSGAWADLPERLAAAGMRCYVPTWPLGSHTLPVDSSAAWSPQGVAGMVLDFIAALDLRAVTLVGNDTGGAISQFALDQAGPDSEIAKVVLTNCDGFTTFPPFPFNLLFGLARHPRATLGLLQMMRLPVIRTSPLGFGALVRRRLTADETRGWLQPYLTVPQVREDVARFAAAVRPRELAEATARLDRFDGPALVCWGMTDRFFTPSLGRRLAAAFRDAEFIEIDGAGTFVALDQPKVLADHITRFVMQDAPMR